MIQLKRIQIITTALALSALLAACAFSGDSPTGTPSEVQEIQSQLLGDMPLPAASKIIGSDSLIIALRNELAIASGSACNTGTIEASHVLRAMDIEGDRLYGAVRISFGRYTSEEDIKIASNCIVEKVIYLRKLALN